MAHRLLENDFGDPMEIIDLSLRAIAEGEIILIEHLLEEELILRQDPCYNYQFKPSGLLR